MNLLLLDTNGVSILFSREHSLRETCLNTVSGHQLLISFMSLGELLLWPVSNNWGATRRSALEARIARFLTLYPDERPCALWVSVGDGFRRAGRPVRTADAWIAAIALQWSCPLVTTDYRDYEAIDGLNVVPIG
jgi:predicted nucleic acid-binding protein